jgi:hypothetical protein
MGYKRWMTIFMFLPKESNKVLDEKSHLENEG